MEPVIKSEMGPLTKVVSEWVQECFKNHDLDITEEGNRATYEFTAENSGDFTYKGYVEVYEERNKVAVYLYSPINVSERKRVEASEVLARINFGLSIGKVVMSFEDGKVRFEGDIGVKDGTLSVAMVNDMVDGGIEILDRYLPAVVAVAHANVAPADAYSNLDGKTETESVLKTADLKEVWAWERFVGSAPLQSWAEELRKAVESKSSDDDWALAGRAAVLVNYDEHYCSEALKRVAATSGMKFVSIPSDDVMSMPPSSAFRSMAPVLVYLEPARWMLESGADDESSEEAERVDNFQSALVDWMHEFKPSRPVIYVVSANKLDDVAERLRRVALFERFITLPQQSLDTVGLNFIEQLGRERCGASLLESTGKVGRLLSWNFSQVEQRDLAMLSLKRIHAREKRALEFLDLVQIATHDLLEEGIPQPVQEEVRRQTAYHEAGHAVISILETGGNDVPDYTSIVPGASGFGGITVESYGFYYAKGDDQTTYQDFRRDIRVGMGGRAAEELIFGAVMVSSGASGDLDSATKHARHAFSRWGFAPAMDKPGQSESNLAVNHDNSTTSEIEHVQLLVRQFLAEEYLAVKNLLTANRAFLDDVAARLMWDPVVDQDEMSEICRKHNIEVCTLETTSTLH